MKKSVRKYRKILNEVIDESFVELKKKVILTQTRYQFKKAYMGVVYFGFFVWIVVFPIAKSCSKNSFKAILAHELSHYELIRNMTFSEKIAFAFKWLFTKKRKVKFETDTDKNVIKKGYGKGLLERVKIIEKNNAKEYLRKRSDSGYLSSKQIQNYRRYQ